ncbi:carbohydrate binding protein with CBM9 domain [Maribacter vaceletii]|uniref:Carbohydrate binding protein with CBM9 domain n=1 Tax=Maribacter vaceletii TaxID=1206816 RepID=A0A495EC12_9FLAO|nr:carbohydrate-binding family 9-like protein [Maribacter vaceletii]RKR14428.1 carbohydrate binding protein with CBM9 domain [Maribacter vaceletii]
MLKIKGIIFLSLLISLTCNAQDKKKLSLGEQPIFKVSKATSSVVVDGKMDEIIWKKTEVGTFDNFYAAPEPNDKQKSTFRMLWGENSLYVFFEFEDKYLTVRETQRDGAPYFDDCAEIFIIPAPEALDTHFGFELNLNKASNDFVYFNNYYNNKNVALKSFNPNFKAEVTYNGTINDNSDIDKGWTMELEIPLSVFGFLGEVVPVEKGNIWTFLALRQDRNDSEGNRRSTSTQFPIADFSKNVHQPTDFGFMQFVE